MVGAFRTRGWLVRGLRRANWIAVREVGMVKGVCWGGMDEGNGGRVLGSGVERTARGFSFRGSTDLR
jgi:hypothetical protein